MPIKAKRFLFTPEELRELLDYDTESGVFTRKVQTSPKALVGDVAGGLNNGGYRQIRVKGVQYMAHRLAWYYIYGVDPKEQIDHINGLTDDNRIDNLREATHAENMRNQGKQVSNTSGYKGVCWNKEKKKFQAQCWANGKNHNLGLYPTPEEAHAVYVAFATKEHGAFANIN